jgi:hypothetical protein
MKGVLVLVVAVVLGIVGGALWCVVIDSYAAASEVRKRPGLIEQVRQNRVERAKPVRERMAKLRNRAAERRGRRSAPRDSAPAVVETPSQAKQNGRAPKAPPVAGCPGCSVQLDRVDLACEQLQ